MSADAEHTVDGVARASGGEPSVTTVPVGTDPPPPPVLDDGDLEPPPVLDDEPGPNDADPDGAPDDGLPGDGDGADEVGGTVSTVSPERSATGRASIEDLGIGADLGPGWEGEIYRRDPGRVSFDARVPEGRRRQPTARAVVHLANFPLPDGRGDYGSGAVEIMATEDVLVVLFEFEPDSAEQPMFSSEGIPGPLRADDFDPDQMQRTMEGMAGVQRFFNVEGQRCFCLYVVIGDDGRRRQLVAVVNEALAGLTISPDP